MLILLDLDGVLADFELGFVEAWHRAHPQWPAVTGAQRVHFHLLDDYPDHQRAPAEALIHAPGFIAGLPPVPGAIEGYRDLVATGFDVRICTSPLRTYTHCVAEKFDWVDRHLGPQAAERLIMTRDKTLVVGDILVDDRPVLEGARTPLWRHILFDAPYNRATTGKLRMTWANWRSVLAGAMYQSDH